MKKINVIVKEKNILELMEDATKGDIIDLQQLVEVDTSYIESIIDSGKDKVYQSKLEDLKLILSKEKEKEINNLENQIKLLRQKLEDSIIIKEKEIETRYIKQINELKKQIELLTQTRFTELESINNKNQLEINEIKKSEEDKYKELEEKYKILLAQQESLIKQKELELENKYISLIYELRQKIEIFNEKKELEIQEIKTKSELELERSLNLQKEKYKEELQSKDETILLLQRQKSNMNIKQTGEDLEVWCDNEVLSYMQNGLFNCVWIKDNKTVKKEGEEHATKADYIFKVFANEMHNENELLASVCLEMKDENPESKNKQANASHFKKLDENRNKKGCKYAVLVSNLELDKPNVLPIYKVREYENMYVVRPGYLMIFLNMIASLSTRFSELVLSKEKEMIELKTKIDLIEEFDKIKKMYLDDPLSLLEKQIDEILKSSEAIKKAASNIDVSCEKINGGYINKIMDKLTKFELKINKSIIKKLI